MAALEVGIAGAVSFRLGSRQSSDRTLSGRQAQLVAAMLMLERHDPVSVDRLAAALWIDEVPDQWRVAVRGLVGRVRRALVEVGLGGDAIIGEPGRYVVALDRPVEIDLEIAAEELRQARRLVEDGDPVAGGRSASAARAVLSRPVLPGAASPWLDEFRRRLAVQHLDTLVVLGVCRGEQGQHDEARGVLDQALGVDPLREDAWRALMRVEVGAGNVAAALAAYERCRSHLVDELGVDPSEATQRLHDELLQSIPTPSVRFVSGPVPAASAGAGAGDAANPNTDVMVGPESYADGHDPVRTPYVGLRAFEEADAPVFFGREGETQTLVRQLGTHGIVAVVGPSGVGKSSLIRAGLLPAVGQGALVDSDTWSTVVVRPGADPVQRLAAELAAVSSQATGQVLATLRSGSDGLHEAAHTLLVGRQPSAALLVVVDQLEEAFTVAPRREAERLVDLLLTATLRRDRRVAVVATLRADFYHRAAGVPGMAELLSREQVVVPPLVGEQVEAAVLGPAAAAGSRLEAGLLGQILGDVSGQPGALPLLQHLLWALWARRTGNVLTRGAYSDLGGVAGALAWHAEDVLATMDDEEVAATRRILLRLVQPGEGTGDTRRPVRDVQLRDGANGADRAGSLAERVLDRLVDARLLTTSSDPVHGWRVVELAHEALITGWPRLQRWIDGSRERLLQHRRLIAAAAEWEADGRGDGWLLSGPRLDEAEGLLLAGRRGEVDLDLAPAERELVEASLAAREEREAAERIRAEHEERLERRARRRLWWLAAVLGTAALVAAGLTVAARDRELVARAELLLARADDAIDEDPEVALLLTLAAGDIGVDDPAMRRGVLTRLHDGLAAHRVLERDQGAEVLVLDADGSRAVRVVPEPDPEGRWAAEVVDLDGSGRTVARLSGHDGDGPVFSAAFSADERFLAIGTRAGTVHVWDTAQWVRVATVATPRGVTVREVALSPDGTYVAATEGIDEFEVTSTVSKVASGEEVTLPGIPRVPDASPSLPTFSPDGSAVARIVDTVGVQVIATDGWEHRHWIPATTVGPPAWSPDSEQLGIVLDDGVLLVEAETGRLTDRLRSATADGTARAAWSPDGTRLVLAQLESATVWDVSGGLDASRAVVVRPGANAGCMVPRLLPGDRLRAGCWDGWLTWHITEAPPGEVASLTGRRGQMGLDVSPDGRLAASGTHADEVTIWDTSTWEPVRILEHAPAAGPNSQVSDMAAVIAWSPDGATLATASQDHVTLWDTSTWQVRGRVDRGGGQHSGVAFTPDGQHLAVDRPAHADVVVVDRAGSIVTELEGQPDRKHFALAFNPDGRSLAGTRATPDGTIVDDAGVVVWYWQQSSRAEILVPAVHEAVAWSGDGQYLVVTRAYSPDGIPMPATRLVDAGTGETVVTYDGHAGNVADLDLSPDGAQLATCGEDGTARVWDTTSGQQLQQMPLGGGLGWCRVRFTAGGGQLVLTEPFVQAGLVYTLVEDQLIEIARERLTRGLTTQECQTLLDPQPCA